MDDRQAVPSVSTAEAEEFWAGGEDALAAEPQPFQSIPDATGCSDPTTSIDMPGVGKIPAHGSASPMRSGREDAGAAPGLRGAWGFAGGEGRGAEREQLLCRFLFAAKDLAESQIEAADAHEPAFCTECLAQALTGAAIAHGKNCRTGRVLGILRQLCRTLPEFHPNRKEAATSGETGCAGDGVRPRGLGDEQASGPAACDLLCIECGERGGDWEQREEVLASDRPRLAINERVCADVAATGMYRYAHRCQKGGAA